MNEQTNTTVIPSTCPNCGKPYYRIWPYPYSYDPGVCECGQKDEPIGHYSLMGWICPVCGRGNSPFSSACPCVPNVKITTSSATNTGGAQ